MFALRSFCTRRLPCTLVKQHKFALKGLTPLAGLETVSDGDATTRKSRKLKFKVDKFGELLVRDIASCNFNIAPLNPQLHPDQNLAFVSLPEAVELKVDCTENLVKIGREGALPSFLEWHLSSCNIEVPIKYNVGVTVEGWSNVKITDLQNERVMVTSEIGNCTISNIQSGGISVSTLGGKITSEGVIHGNAILKTRQSGSVSINKILSQYFDVKTDRGAIDVKSLYSEQSKFTTRSGSIHLGNAHKRIEVTIAHHGDLTVDTLDGNLSASVNSGDVDIFIAQTEGIDIHVQSGDIELKLSTSVNAHLDLEGNSIEVDDQIKLSNKNKTSEDGIVSITGDLMQQGASAKPETIRAHTKEGSVVVHLQSWIESVKLANKSEE